MKNILLFGAGLSSTFLIEYLLNYCRESDCRLTVSDTDLKTAKERVGENEYSQVININIFDEEELLKGVSSSDIVLSMLPARFHAIVAEACLEKGKHLLTASYAADDLKKLGEKFKEKSLLLLCEMGLDPGIDHMSAMKVIDEIRNEGGTIVAFESFTGGLLAPSEEDNPWEYKFTWNPRNVVLAGQGVVKFIQEGRYKFIPYSKVFRRTEVVHIPVYGYFEGYANRDSLNYRSVYGLDEVKTIYRGTFRRVGFCKAWDVFVQLGATDDTYQMEGVQEMTHRQFINSFLSYNPNDSVELKLAHYMNLDMESDIMYKLNWLGIFSSEFVGLDNGTPAQILEHILKKKWTINENDRDQIVMWHKFNYELNGEEKEIQSHLVVTGESKTKTAMAKTVGLPLAIATKLVLEEKIELKGLQLPIKKEVYEPVLKELEGFDIRFVEREID